MKFFKYIFFINLVFSFISINKVNAITTNDKFSKTYIGTYHYVSSNGKFGDFEYFTRTSDGQIAYCIEPGVSLSSGTYQGYYDLPNGTLAGYVGISSEILSKISLIAHFGWGYNGHYGYDWIVATQSLIWKELGYNFQFTSRNSKASPWQYVINTPNEVQDKMNEIERLILDYQSMPSFNTYYAKIPLNESYNFIDYSNKINGLKIKNCENCTATISNDLLNIKPNGNQNGKVIAEKVSFGWSTKFSVYEHPEGQNMLVPGLVESIETSVSYEVVSGKLNLFNYDEITNSCKPQQSGGDLAGSTFKLYKNDGTHIKDIVINENCTASIQDLELGKYYIVQTKAGLNYDLNPNKFYFELTLENPIQDLTIYNKMLLGQLKIYKFDSKTNSCKSISKFATLTGATYGLYYQTHPLNWKLITKLNINENCEALSEKNLLPGNYYLKELNAPKGYNLDEQKHYFEVTKDNANEIITKTLIDNIYETNLVINKTYLVENGVSPEVGAQFDIYYENSNTKFETLTIDESGSSNLLVPYGSYTIKQSVGKSGYHLADDIRLDVDETSNKNTYFHLLNKPYLAKLKVVKIDENGNKVKIKGIKFKIYDVINQKYVCQEIFYPYNKTICEYETDENGEFITPNYLYPSNYIIEEVDQLINGYVWNKEQIEFTIDENIETDLIIKEFTNLKVKGNIKLYVYDKTDLEKIPIVNKAYGLYKNAELITISKTNEEGYIEFSGLPLGEYIIKGLDDQTIYNVHLKYKNQYTPIVEETVEIVNQVPDNLIVIDNLPDTGKNEYKSKYFLIICLVFIGIKILINEKIKKDN